MASRIQHRLNAVAPHAWSWLFTAVFVTPWCGYAFGCGCIWLWAGTARFCNIHHATGAHCPWCLHGTAAFLLTAAGIALTQSVAVSLVQRRQPRAGIATMAGIAMFFLAASVAAWAWAIVS